jgi:RNA polymerase sigma factor (sigma-70 family)
VNIDGTITQYVQNEFCRNLSSHGSRRCPPLNRLVRFESRRGANIAEKFWRAELCFAFRGMARHLWLMPESEMPGPDSGASARDFRTTHWSLVLAAGNSSSEHSAEALEQLCRTYWYPLYAFVRRQGHPPAEAQDLTQEFFSHLLSRDALSGVDPAKGRFRSFLLASLKNLMANEWKRGQRQKRGGGAVMFSLDAVEAEERYRLEPSDNVTPEKIYERRWAEALLERVLTRLREECDASGRTQRFETLKVFLLDDKGTMPLAEAAERLGLSVIAVKGVVHRLRQRYREIFHEEVANTVNRPEDIDEEIRYLLTALAGET